MIPRASAWTGALGLALLVTAARSVEAQTITVVANRGFRPTPVLAQHLQYRLGVDTADGALVMRDVTINPVTIGTFRVEGIQPLEREPEGRPFPDTVRFEPEGRVVLSVGNGPARAPFTIEAVPSRVAPAFRLNITARSWQLSRLILVSLVPADLHEARWRSLGWGEEDRVRIDDRAATAYLTDSAMGPVTVAVVAGRGARGRLQGGTTDILIGRDIGGSTAVERRRVATVSLILEPDRDAQGDVSVEVLVGLGASENEASRNAQTAAGEWAPPSRPLLRVATPSREVGMLATHMLAAARPMLEYDRIMSLRHVPARADLPGAQARDGWYGVLAARRLGDADAVCGEYQLMQRFADSSGTAREAVANRLSPRGRVVWTDDWSGRWLGDKEAYQLLKAWACYRVRRDAAWLASQLPALRRLARVMLESDRDRDGLIEVASIGTYAGLGPLAEDSVYRAEDPYVNALAAYALDRLAELEDAVAAPGGAAGEASALRAASARIRSALPGLWRSGPGWFAFHAMPDGGRSWDHPHLQAVDALVFGALSDSMARTMVGTLMRPSWWDASVRTFNVVPLDDGWHDAAAAWRGAGSHALDFKALHAVFAFGTPAQRAIAWGRLSAAAERILRANYGRPGLQVADNGLAMLSVGAFLDMLGRGLFGVEEHLDRIEIAPHLEGIADDFTWRLDGWIVGDDTLNVAYRPADRSLTFRLGALTSRRVVLRVPWFTSQGCVSARRGRDSERLTPVFQADGSAYVDLRAFYDPAEVTVSARACGP